MTTYETAAVDKFMKRLEVHERGHLRLHAEVARLQTGSHVVPGNPQDARVWGNEWIQETNDLAGAAQISYEEVVNHSLTQNALGGLNTRVQVCNPQAAILGDVPAGEVESDYLSQLELGKLSPTEPDVVVTAPVSWTVVEGELPPGVHLSSSSGVTGSLTGNQTQAGNFQFTVRATDANDLTATRVISLDVNGASLRSYQIQGYNHSNILCRRDGQTREQIDVLREQERTIFMPSEVTYSRWNHVHSKGCDPEGPTQVDIPGKRTSTW